MSAVLEVRNLSVSFSGFQAINDVSFSMDEGAIYSVIGPNGAGKSTLFNLITGLNKPNIGSVSYLGQDITNMSPQKRCHIGIGRSFQRSNIFPALSVFENIQTAIVSREKENWRMFLPLGNRHRQESEKS